VGLIRMVVVPLALVPEEPSPVSDPAISYGIG